MGISEGNTLKNKVFCDICGQDKPVAETSVSCFLIYLNLSYKSRQNRKNTVQALLCP